MKIGETRPMKNGGIFTMTNSRRLGSRAAADKRRGVRFKPLTIHPHADPLVRVFVEILNRERITLTYVAERSGIARCVMHRWRCRSNPSVALMQAALNSIGYELRIARRDTAF